MKNKIMAFFDKMYNYFYRKLLFFTYKHYVKKKSKHLRPLSKLDKKKIKKYWHKYLRFVPLNEYKWYQKIGNVVDPKLITNVVWASKIEPYFTNLKMVKGFQDKNYFETIVGKANSPETVVHCIDGQFLDKNYDYFNLESISNEEDELICKPSTDSCGGRGIQFLDTKSLNANKLAELKKEYKGNFVIQKRLKQHEFFSYFNESSINTIRVVSFFYKNEVNILSAFMRVGKPNVKIDNYSSGGSFVPITKDWKLCDFAYQENLARHEFIKFDSLPSKKEFKGKEIPFSQEIINLVKKNHLKLLHFKIIYWDIAIREDGTPIIIEYNLLDSSVDAYQINNGPIFGDLTDEVLDEVFHKDK